MLWRCVTDRSGRLHILLTPFRTHLSEQVCQLLVDLGPEGGTSYVDEGLSVHLLGHLQLLQSGQGFVFCCLEALSDDSRMKTLQQQINVFQTWRFWRDSPDTLSKKIEHYGIIRVDQSPSFTSDT